MRWRETMAVWRRGPDAGHRWRFERVGGFNQVRLDSGADLLHLGTLDPKLWAALSCPVRGIEFDTRTLELIDTDHDGRIRLPEIRAALQWALVRLKDPAVLLAGAPALPFDALRDDTPESAQLLAAARRIAAHSGRPDAQDVRVNEASDTTRVFAQTRFNGDGIIPEHAAEDETTQAVIRDIIACLGGEPDRSGKPGVSQPAVDSFFGQIEALDRWWRRAEDEDAKILPLGEATEAAMNTLAAVRGKIDDFFVRCRLAAYDPRTEAVLSQAEETYAAQAAKDLTISLEEWEVLPVARPDTDQALPLETGVNPAWKDRLKAFQTAVVQPLLGARSALSAEAWEDIKSRFTAYEKWRQGRPATQVEKLGLVRIREILAGPAKETLRDLVARDKAMAAEADALTSVEKLARLHRDLYTLLNNFVTFRDFFSADRLAVFQAGRLYLDSRACDLCLRVQDAARHAPLAGQAKAYLVYCDCVRPTGGEKISIVAAVTNGDSDRLMVGRNGVFIDRQGRDWDATITFIVDNPISVLQAFLSPYKRLIRMIEEQVAKRAASAEADVDKKLAATAETTASVDKQPAAGPRPIDTGTVAALGVAVGAIGTAISALVTGLLRLPAWQMPLVFLGLILAVSGPSMIIAALKLRQRNLGPILDACGWAVNARARISIPFGKTMTSRAVLPPGSLRTVNRRASPWAWGALLLALAVSLALKLWSLCV